MRRRSSIVRAWILVFVIAVIQHQVPGRKVQGVLGLGEGRFAASEAFDPTVLTLKRGDALVSLKQIHRWHWCRNASGAEGWVADYLLKAVE